MSKTVTSEEIRALIESQIEPEEPQTTIVEYLGTQSGKRLTERHLQKLRELTGDDSLWLRKQYGMTHINWGEGGDTPQGGSLLVGWQEKGIVIPSKEDLIERNSCYFAGAQIRNARRKKVLRDHSQIAGLVYIINMHNHLKEALNDLLDYGKPFDSDQYAIRKAFVDEEDKE